MQNFTVAEKDTAGIYSFHPTSCRKYDHTHQLTVCMRLISEVSIIDKIYFISLVPRLSLDLPAFNVARKKRIERGPRDEARFPSFPDTPLFINAQYSTCQY